MPKPLKRCAFEGCKTFVVPPCREYCKAHSETQGYIRKKRGNPNTGGKTRNTKQNPMHKPQVGNAAKVHEVGLMDSYGERQILRSIFGGGW